MVYYVMSNNGKFIECDTVLPLEALEYYVNETKVRLKDSGNKIKGIIGDNRNSINENNIQTPGMGEDDLISQLSLSFDIESDNIDNINEEFYSDCERPDYYE